MRDGSLRKDGLIDKNDEFFLDALRDKCEEVYYKTEISKQQSFDDSFVPEEGWEEYLEDVKEKVG